VSYPQKDLTKLCSPLPLEKEDYQVQVSLKDSDLSTDHSAHLLAYKNLTLKHTVIIIIIITTTTTTSEKCTWRTGVCPLKVKQSRYRPRVAQRVPGS